MNTQTPSVPKSDRSRRYYHDHSVSRVRLQGNCRHPYEPDEPSGYLAWHEWAEKKAETHKQKQCPDCGLWVIYEPRTESAHSPSGEAQ